MSTRPSFPKQACPEAVCGRIFRIISLAALSLAVLLAGGCAMKPEPRGVQSPVQASNPPAPEPTQTGMLTTAAGVTPAAFEGDGWQSLFDGTSLAGWQEIEFSGRAEVRVESGAMVLPMGSPFTGVRFTNDFPKVDYEIAFDAMRLMGSDFFCGLTVPVGEAHCSFIVGGWGGGLVGISSLDGYDASENETTKFMGFEKGRWYRIRLRVTGGRIEAWINQEKLVNVDTTVRKVSLRPGEIELSVPLGIAAWQTAGAVREVKWRRVSVPEGPLKPGF